jgi:SAM-dependent methyltransferase
MKKNYSEYRDLIIGMREVYETGKNVMEFAKNFFNQNSNQVDATLIAYDLQTGTYTKEARNNPEENIKWCTQLANIILPYLPNQGSVLEVGSGEATTLSGIISILKNTIGNTYGFDLSLSRTIEGNEWLSLNNNKSNLFVGDLFNIPLEDNSIDVVYSSHSLEPNGGREEEAIKECLRVSRNALVLVEPAYEFASEIAQSRMMMHGYVRGLKEAAEKLGAVVVENRLLGYFNNPLNPSGVLVLKKNVKTIKKSTENIVKWRCPLTRVELLQLDDVFYAKEVGIAYPIVRGIPLLRDEHAIIFSKLK